MTAEREYGQYRQSCALLEITRWHAERSSTSRAIWRTHDFGPRGGSNLRTLHFLHLLPDLQVATCPLTAGRLRSAARNASTRRQTSSAGQRRFGNSKCRI